MSILHFAYGSNMLISQMEKRCKSAKAIGCGKIDGWIVVFNKKSKDGSGKANLLLSPGDVTWGVVWEMDREDLKNLDNIEKGYTRKTMQIQMTDARVLSAEIYISDILTDNPVASYKYKQYVVEGAIEHDLPADYIQYLQQLPSKPD